MTIIEYAPNMFRALNGVFCLFKPPGVSMKGLRSGLQQRLANDLNRMKCRPLNQRVVYHPENLDTDLPVVTTAPDLADSPLVVGPRYEPSDIEIAQAGSMDYFVSGVTVMGLSYRGIAAVNKLQAQRPLRVYHLDGVLGYSTDNMMTNGRTVEKSTYYHVTHHKLDRMLASIQAYHSRRLWNTAALDIQSEEAYQLACQGPLRPDSENTEPYIYAVKCVHFKSPHFTLEVHVINETGSFLLEMINEIGLQLKSNATCSKVRRIRYGDFTLSQALLRKHWYSKHILENIKLCEPLCTELRKKEAPRTLEKTKTKTSKELCAGDNSQQIADPFLLT